MDVKASFFPDHESKEFYWHLKAANGEIVACSPDGYASEQISRDKLILFLKAKAELNPKAAEQAAVGFQVFQGEDNQWYWRFSCNGLIIAKGGEGYTEKGSCEAAVRRTKSANLDFSPA